MTDGTSGQTAAGAASYTKKGKPVGLIIGICVIYVLASVFLSWQQPDTVESISFLGPQTLTIIGALIMMMAFLMLLREEEKEEIQEIIEARSTATPGQAQTAAGTPPPPPPDDAPAQGKSAFEAVDVKKKGFEEAATPPPPPPPVVEAAVVDEKQTVVFPKDLGYGLYGDAYVDVNNGTTLNLKIPLISQDELDSL